jgi:DNA-binding MarR family transcriptional regulator
MVRAMSPPGEDALSTQLALLITRSRRVTRAAISRGLETNGFSMQAWVAVAHLCRFGPLAQRDLADAVGQHPAGVSRLVDDLERRRLVRRKRDDQDRRLARVEVTAKGRAMYDAGRPHVVESLTEALQSLSVREQEDLRDLLTKLVSSEGPDAHRAADAEEGDG